MTPSLISFISIILLNLIFFVYIRELNRDELKLLHIPFITTLFVPSGYLGMALFYGTQYREIVSLIFQVSFALAFLVVTNSLFLVIYYIVEKPISMSLVVITIYNSIVMSIVYLNFSEVTWVQGHWQINYIPNIMFFLAGFGLIIFFLGLNLLLYELLKSSPYRDIRILFTLMNIIALISLFLLILRDPLDIPPNTWTIGISIQWIVFSIIVIRRPEIFLTSSVVPKFLLVMNKEMGTPIRFFHFIPNELESSDEMLFTGAISAVQSVMEESVKSSERIKYVGLENLHLEIQTKAQFEFILASENKSSALRSILEKIATNWDIDISRGQISSEDEQEMKDTIHKFFIHQIRRLDLFLDEKQMEK